MPFNESFNSFALEGLFLKILSIDFNVASTVSPLSAPDIITLKASLPSCLDKIVSITLSL